MKKYWIILFSILFLVSCRYDFPIIGGYKIFYTISMSETYNSKFGLLLYNKIYAEFIAGSIKHVYYNDRIIVARQDSLSYPTWYVIQPRKFETFNGPSDDSVEGPLTTRQRDSILQGLSIRLEDLRYNDYTAWYYPRD